MTKLTESDFQRLCDDFVRKEVVCCVSSLVATLAQGADYVQRGRGTDGALAMLELTSQAQELAAPVLDYEEAAMQAGWEKKEFASGVVKWWNPAQDDGSRYCVGREGYLLEDYGLDAYEREVFEHWGVSPWLADKLIAQGEKVDKDFANMCVWARTCTGQGISSDGVIQRIAKAIVEG